MKNIIRQLILILSAAFLFSSCEKKILDQKPQTALDALTAYTTRQGVEAGLLGCYNALQGTSYYGLEYWALSDMYAGVITHTGTFPTYAQINNRIILPDNTNTTGTWNQIYNGINRCNNILASIDALNDPAYSKTQGAAEARFLRALMYFDLLRLYGGSPAGYNLPNGRGLPLRLTPTLSPTDAAPLPLSPEADIWKQVDADLDYAIANLKANVTGRATANAATALKARAALYKNDFVNAEALATTVINNLKGAGTGLAADYSTLWLNQNIKPESIFELQYDINNTNSIAFYYFPTAFGGRNEIGSSTTLVAQPASDLRRAANVRLMGTTNKTFKYSRIAGNDNVIIIRLAELYLIRSEARVKKATPDIEGALADLNVIRNRAGLPSSTTATAPELLNEIYQENYFEFAHEGHALFDFRRTNRLASTFPGNFSGQNDFRALFPTPQREIDNSNGLLARTPGY
jgi:hypothetical protein